MKQIIASVFLDILSYTVEISFIVFLNFMIIAARVYKLRLADVNFLNCLTKFSIEFSNLVLCFEGIVP